MKMENNSWPLLTGALLLNLGLATPAQALSLRIERWLELREMTGRVITIYANQSRSAKLGDRLQAIGDGIATNVKATAILVIDTEIGQVNIGSKTQLRVRSLQTVPSGGRITQLEVTGGQARLKVRPFSNPDSRLEILTPAGIAGVRGTEFGVNVQPSGKSAVATLEGTVVATAQAQSVEVKAGFQIVMIPGEPPSPPVPITNDTSLTFHWVKTFAGHIRKVRLEGQIDPVNTVFVAGEPIDSDRNGRFSVLLSVPNFPRYHVVVVTPLGKTQDHELALR